MMFMLQLENKRQIYFDYVEEKCHHSYYDYHHHIYMYAKSALGPERPGRDFLSQRRTHSWEDVVITGSQWTTVSDVYVCALSPRSTDSVMILHFLLHDTP